MCHNDGSLCIRTDLIRNRDSGQPYIHDLRPFFFGLPFDFFRFLSFLAFVYGLEIHYIWHNGRSFYRKMEMALWYIQESSPRWTELQSSIRAILGCYLVVTDT
jgi:hypothetical protein